MEFLILDNEGYSFNYHFEVLPWQHYFPYCELLYIAATMLPPLVENPLYLMMHGYALQEIQY